MAYVSKCENHKANKKTQKNSFLIVEKHNTIESRDRQ